MTEKKTNKKFEGTNRRGFLKLFGTGAIAVPSIVVVVGKSTEQLVVSIPEIIGAELECSCKLNLLMAEGCQCGAC